MAITYILMQLMQRKSQGLAWVVWLLKRMPRLCVHVGIKLMAGSWIFFLHSKDKIHVSDSLYLQA